MCHMTYSHPLFVWVGVEEKGGFTYQDHSREEQDASNNLALTKPILNRALWYFTVISLPAARWAAAAEWARVAATEIWRVKGHGDIKMSRPPVVTYWGVNQRLHQSPDQEQVRHTHVHLIYHKVVSSEQSCSNKCEANSWTFLTYCVLSWLSEINL